VAFGATERLYKECARVGHYSIPQAGVKGQKVPKTAEGEDLGVGEGWWYDGMPLEPVVKREPHY
jgi:cytochrome b pre-mRNA-processing protein 3